MVFLHGYLSSSKSFGYQLNFFSKDFEVYAPDFKGFGQNLGMEKPYSLDDYVKEFKEFLDKNNIGCPHVIAHSFGGRVALKALAEDSQLVDKLVLTGSAGLKPKLTVKKAVRRVAFKVLKRFVKKEKLSRFYSKDYLMLDEVMKQSFIKIVNEHLDYTLPLIKNKTLIVFGKNDRETPLYMAKKLNKGIVDSKLIIIENAGHFCFVDKPYKFNTEVREFLLS